MNILLKRFRFLRQVPSIFFKILIDFLNGYCLICIFLLVWVLIRIFHEFLSFQCILKKFDSVVKIDVNPLHGLKLLFKFKNFFMEKFFFEKPLFLSSRWFGVLTLRLRKAYLKKVYDGNPIDSRKVPPVRIGRSANRTTIRFWW